MGFYIRKAWNFGLFRLNLSRSGLGYSWGIRGLRFGRNAQGRRYMHAGMFGFFYRKFFKS